MLNLIFSLFSYATAIAFVVFYIIEGKFEYLFAAIGVVFIAKFCDFLHLLKEIKDTLYSISSKIN